MTGYTKTREFGGMDMVLKLFASTFISTVAGFFLCIILEKVVFGRYQLQGVMDVLFVSLAVHIVVGVGVVVWMIWKCR